MADASDPLAGLDPQPHPSPNRVWQERLRVPRYAVPDRIGDMAVTEELRAEYRGHEALLKNRAKHPPHCRRAWDAMARCLAQKLDASTCEAVHARYAPCAKEMDRARAAAGAAAEMERRRALAVGARAMEQRREQQRRLQGDEQQHEGGRREAPPLSAAAAGVAATDALPSRREGQ